MPAQLLPLAGSAYCVLARRFCAPFGALVEAEFVAPDGILLEAGFALAGAFFTRKSSSDLPVSNSARNHEGRGPMTPQTCPCPLAYLALLCALRFAWSLLDDDGLRCRAEAELLGRDAVLGNCDFDALDDAAHLTHAQFLCFALQGLDLLLNLKVRLG